MYDVLTKSYIQIGKKKIHLNDSFYSLKEKMKDTTEETITVTVSSLLVGKKTVYQKSKIDFYGEIS